MWDEFLDLICDFRPLLRLAFAIVVVLILLSVWGIQYVTPGTETYYITIANFVILGIMFVFLITLIRACHRTDQF